LAGGRLREPAHERGEGFGYGDEIDIFIQKRKDKTAFSDFLISCLRGARKLGEGV